MLETPRRACELLVYVLTRLTIEAQRQLAEADAARRREGIKTPAQLPSTDSDSTVLPNKEGGYAPNYTPTAAVDTHRDFIVDPEVLANANENAELVPMVDRVEEAFGQRPGAVLADGLNATGPNIVDLEQRGVEFLSPLAASEPKEGGRSPATVSRLIASGMRPRCSSLKPALATHAVSMLERRRSVG